MVWKNDKLLFAIDVAWDDVAWDDVNVDADLQLVDQYARRLEGFYLTPASELLQYGHEFAAGLILLCALDALVKVEIGGMRNTTRKDYVSFAQSKLLRDKGASEILYEAFRCGLAHEGRVKEAFFIDAASDQLLEDRDSARVLNPRVLLSRLEDIVKNLRDVAVNNDINGDAAAIRAIFEDHKKRHRG